MKLKEIIEELQLEIVAGKDKLDTEITGGYVSDMLSDVIGNCKQGELWITLQVHENIVAVATLKELAAIIIINGKVPGSKTLEKADSEGVPMLSTELPAFELAGKLYKLGVGAV